MPEHVGRVQASGIPTQGSVVAAHGAPIAPAMQHLATEPLTPARAGRLPVLPGRLFRRLEVQAHIGANGVEVSRCEIEVDQQASRFGNQGGVSSTKEFFDLRPEAPNGMRSGQCRPIVVQGLAVVAAFMRCALREKCRYRPTWRNGFGCLSA